MKLLPLSKTLYEKRGRDSTVQVIERGDKRELRFGNHVVQSAFSEADPDFLQLQYTRAMMVGLLFLEKPTRFLHIGLGAGSIPRVIHRFFPGGSQLVVELRPEVIDVAYRFFQLPTSPRLEVVQAEGATFLRHHAEKHDLIFLDAFHADGAEDGLQTVEFFRSVRNCLGPNGWVVDNVWGSDRELLKRVTQNLVQVFPHLYSLSVGAESNVIFFGGGAEAKPPNRAVFLQWAKTLAQLLSLDLVALAQRVRGVEKPGGPAGGLGWHGRERTDPFY